MDSKAGKTVYEGEQTAIWDETPMFKFKFPLQFQPDQVFAEINLWFVKSSKNLKWIYVDFNEAIDWPHIVFNPKNGLEATSFTDLDFRMSKCSTFEFVPTARLF